MSAPECATQADHHLAGIVPAATFAAVFESAVTRNAERLCTIAADPRFQEAVTWQSRTAVAALRGLARSTGGNRATDNRATDNRATRNSRRRDREALVTRYWQRYCAKNDTIGFFGPVSWAGLDPSEPAVRLDPGTGTGRAGFLRRTVIDYEWRTLTAFADHLAGDPRYRRWIPVARQPHVQLANLPPTGSQVRRTSGPPVPLTPAQAALFTAATGVRPAGEVVADAMAACPALRRESDGYLAISRLAEDGLLRWGIDLPLNLNAETALRHWLASIGDAELRDAAITALTRLDMARAGIAAAAGAPALHAALDFLDAEFVAVTGASATHRPGETYVGRGLVYQDAERNLDITIGKPVIDALAGPLTVVAQAARWLTAAVAQHFLTVIRGLYDEAVTDLGCDDIPLGELWYLANGMLFSEGTSSAVLDEFTDRWSLLLGMDTVPAGERQVRRAVSDLLPRLAEVFPATEPGWPAARLHSPDLHLAARDAQALGRGEFTAVLGEVHVAWLTADSGVFVRFHPDRAALRAAVARDLGQRTVLLYPPDFPQLTARITEALIGEDDLLIGYVAAPQWAPEQVVPLAGLTVHDTDGELVATDPRGRTWSLPELFGPFLSALAVNAFRAVAEADHAPRVSIDRLVVQRETWRTTIGDTGLAVVGGERERYLAVRRWRAALGLPERVFIRVGTEIKPVYVDLTSPAYVAALCAMVRSAMRTGGPAVSLTISEMLPGPEEAWLTDAEGRRYLSELRITMRDPRPARRLGERP